MAPETAKTIADAYRWQSRLGSALIALGHRHIVADPAHPDVWDANHADEVTAATDVEIDAVFSAMDDHLASVLWGWRAQGAGVKDRRAQGPKARIPVLHALHRAAAGRLSCPHMWGRRWTSGTGFAV